MSKLYLSHITSFSYSNFVVESSNQIILYPYNDTNQQVISHSLKITGNPNIYTNFDWYGNKVGFFNYLLPHKNLSIESEAEISMNLKIFRRIFGGAAANLLSPPFV